MKRVHPLLLSVLSGLLLWAAWPVSPLTFLIFAGFVPLLWLEHQGVSRGRFLSAVYLAMLIWNIGTTWWVCHASLPGGIVAMLFSSGFMSLPWIGYRFIKRKLGQRWGFVSLITFWLTFEFIYLNIQLSWPWLTLGNVFASHPGWVQWYELTGSSGGSLWVMIVNILLFKAINNTLSPADQRKKKYIWYAALAAIIPFIASALVAISNVDLRTYALNRSDANDKEVVIVQPNIDPYEKFSASLQVEQLQKLISLSESQITPSTALVVWPETALSGVNGFNERNIKEYPSLEPLWLFLKRHPQLSLFTGIEGYKLYSAKDKTKLSRNIKGTDQYVDVFNSATLLTAEAGYKQTVGDDSSLIMDMSPDLILSELPVAASGIIDPIKFYHKSKLVPGVETLPTYLRFLDKWFEQFGGTSGGYASQEERTVTEDRKSGFKIVPAICYESIYGEFLTAYVRNGANVISIITNDGWWENTAGYKQHMQYARLRAIETRRWVIRSANTGISCFIDDYGNVIDPQPWDKEAAIKLKVPVKTNITFFVKYGDIISRIAFAAAGILLLWSIALPKRNYGTNTDL